MASVTEEPSHCNYPVLKEYPLQSNLLQLIPAKAQKGLTTLDLEFTCIHADGHYIVLGSNVGIVYVFDRIRNHLCRLRNEQKDAITSVKVIISLECLVVFGCKNGALFVYKIPFAAEEPSEKFIVEGLHSSSITALEWSKNGMQFFSGDESGLVVCTEIDHFEHQSRSRVLINEPSKIVQLSCSQMHLVISTLFRSVLYSCESGTTTKIGQKERKCFGPFGAIIFHTKQTPDEVVFASRPGQRLWKSDKSGVIHETMIFKNALSEPHPTIALLSGEIKCSSCDFQFEHLTRYNEQYILISSDSALLLIDPELKSIVASCPKLDPIVSVAASNEEIFVLRGLRHIIRISSNPDPYPCAKVSEEPSLMEELLVPFKGISSFVKERSDSLAAQTESSSIFGWLKKSRSASSPVDMPSDILNTQDQLSSETLPEVVKLDSKDSVQVKIDTSTVIDYELPKIEISLPLLENETDDIVYKPKKKKRVRFRSVSPKNSDRKPLNPVSETNKELDNKTGDKHQNKVNLTQDSNSNDNVSTDVTDSMQKTESLLEMKDSPNDQTNCDTTEGSTLNDNETTNPSDILNPQETNLSEYNSNTDRDQNINNNNQDVDEYKTKTYTDQNIYNDQIINNEDNTNDIDDIYSFDASKINSELKQEIESQSSESSSNTSANTASAEPQKYGVDWIEYKTPELLIDLCISNSHIFCVDIKNRLYYSNYPVLGLQLKLLNQPADRIAVSPNEIVVWVLYKGVVYAAHRNSNTVWENVEWRSVARNIESLAVDDNNGWYINTSGELILRPNLILSRPDNYPETISCKSSMVQVSAWNGIAWVLMENGSIGYVDSAEKKTKRRVKEILSHAVPNIDSIFLGVHETGWIIDSKGIIHFLTGVTSKTPEGVGKPWEVEASSYFVKELGTDNFLKELTQLPKAVLKALKREKLTALLRGKQQICLSTSMQGIWFCKTFDNLVYSNQKNIFGHAWESVIPSGTSTTTKWKIISAAGVSNSQGSVWCLDHTNELFCLNVSLNTLETVELPPINCGVQALVPTTESLWLLSKNGDIFVRAGMTPNSPGGNRWKQLDLNQLASEKITFISCSSEATWACTDFGRVMIRLGSLCPSSNRKLPQAWTPLTSSDEEYSNGTLYDKIYVGPLGYPVWALDDKCNVYVRDGVSSSFPIGTKWILIPELKAWELGISKSAVWLLEDTGKIYRRFGVSEKNPCGDYWKQIPGNMDFLSVTEDDDLWGLQKDSMFVHSSYALNCMPSGNKKKPPARCISEDDDWEDIMAETSDSEF
ncbi:hypothetical protein JTE90_009588 [Oedothorax gibbosus]|uniref:HPS5-like beta-propeller domain-containing protein n=1 Tax=Oedothorax gibbosus TaxID=931172 RepID=A0AAV6VJQ3_9ARAC|nr:hypothetical protein JTE90_009588 [Oedothorax gibbosus]